MASFEKYKEQVVEIAHGRVDALLGDVGGWRGRVIRRFSVNGTSYVDIELITSSMEALAQNRRDEFIRKDQCFTRVRVPESAVSEVQEVDDARRRMQLQESLQTQWYAQSGSRRSDPTKESSDKLYSTLKDPSRRRTMQTMVAVGIGTIGLAFSVSRCNDGCNGSPGYSSWGRSGGYYG